MVFPKFAVSLLTFGLFSFVILSVFGLGHMSGMMKNEGGDMTGCIFTGQTMLCKMSIIEHISLWQSMFTAIPQETALLTAILILLTAIRIALPQSSPPLGTKIFSKWRLYFARHADQPFFDPLRLALSKGILHPKIYEPSVI